MKWAAEDSAFFQHYELMEAEFWPKCPTETWTCDQGTIMNKLNCGCTQDPTTISTCQTPPQCPDGELNIPYDICSCQNVNITREFFPTWASLESIKLSLSIGKYDETTQTYEPVTTNEPVGETWEVCPWEYHSRDCSGQDLYWNELACACLATETCWQTCP